MKHVAPEARARVVLRECAIAYAVLLASIFGGPKFMQLLQLSDNWCRASRSAHWTG